MREKTVLLCVYVILNLSCTENTFQTIQLTKDNSQCFVIEDQFDSFPFFFLSERFEKYYNSLRGEYKNLPKVDSLYFATTLLDYQKFIYELGRDGLIDKDTYSENFNRLNLDTLVESKKNNNSVVTVLTGIKNGKQFVLVDENNDKDFKDDTLFFVPKVNSQSNLCSLENNKITKKLTFSYNIKGKIETYNREVAILQQSDFYAFQRDNHPITKRMGLVGKLKDYWKGNLLVGGEKYEVIIKGQHSSLASILIKKHSTNLSQNDIIYNNSFKYDIKDTVFLSGQSFVIDSLSSPIDQLFINKLNDSLIEKRGSRIGEKIANYKLSGINGDSISIQDVNNKKFTLLDFWGTWCLPCTKLTPRLKKLFKGNKKDLNIIGLAFDNSKEKVVKYAEENQMDWMHSYFDIKKKPKILKDLKIIGYPTLILIDSDNKIIYKGSTKEAIDEIENIIHKQK